MRGAQSASTGHGLVFRQVLYPKPIEQAPAPAAPAPAARRAAPRPGRPAGAAAAPPRALPTTASCAAGRLVPAQAPGRRPPRRQRLPRPLWQAGLPRSAVGGVSSTRRRVCQLRPDARMPTTLLCPCTHIHMGELNRGARCATLWLWCCMWTFARRTHTAQAPTRRAPSGGSSSARARSRYCGRRTRPSTSSPLAARPASAQRSPALVSSAPSADAASASARGLPASAAAPAPA